MVSDSFSLSPPLFSILLQYLLQFTPFYSVFPSIIREVGELAKKTKWQTMSLFMQEANHHFVE